MWGAAALSCHVWRGRLAGWLAGNRSASPPSLPLLYIQRTAQRGWQVVWLTRRPFVLTCVGAEAPLNGVNLCTELLFVLPIGLFGYGAFVAQKYVVRTGLA